MDQTVDIGLETGLDGGAQCYWVAHLDAVVGDHEVHSPFLHLSDKESLVKFHYLP